MELKLENYEKKLDLICEAVDSYRKDELSTLVTLLVIDTILHPSKVTKEDLEWANNWLNKHRKETI